jgi:hypothetical protein
VLRQQDDGLHADADDPDHQRNLAQREYYGSRKWRRLFKRRALVEGVFGILKNASRQRLRRGQNRLPGLVMASIIAAIKVSVYNEEQLRIWHNRTGRGPADHPLLQPNPPHWGFRDLTKDEAKALDAERLRRLRAATSRPLSRLRDAYRNDEGPDRCPGLRRVLGQPLG